MNTKQIFVTALLLAAGSASAKELNAPMALEASSRGGSKLLSLDFESDGNAASFSFRVVFPEGAKSIDTSRCLSELPKGFVEIGRASCRERV